MPNVPSLKWGIQHEKVALEEFSTLMSDTHNNFEIEDCGLRLLLENPYIGASADGLFTCKCHNDVFTVEIKCPYSHRETATLDDALYDSKFCLDINKILKANHCYYTQMQLQMYIYDVEKAYLIIWTPKWLYYTLVLKDVPFITSMIHHLKEFYATHIVPELLTRKLENGKMDNSVPSSSDQILYCYCNTEYNDQETWIGCDAVSCKWQWFHLDCVNLKRIPKGKWYLENCEL